MDTVIGQGLRYIFNGGKFANKALLFDVAGLSKTYYLFEKRKHNFQTKLENLENDRAVKRCMHKAIELGLLTDRRNTTIADLNIQEKMKIVQNGD